MTVCFVAAFVLAAGTPAESATLEVRPPGGTGALGDVYTSIQQAIDDANAGDTINVAAGTYEDDTVGPDGHLVINKANLTLKSTAGKDSTTINVSNGVGIDIQAGASGFVLGGAAGKGFTIAGGADTSFVIQLVNGPSDVEISYNAIDSTGNASMGVSIGAAGASDLTISDNDFTADSSDGCIWAPRVVNLTVSDNTFDGGAYAIQTNGVTANSQSLISGNEITNATGSGGIVIGNGEGTSDLVITGNTITGCTNGIFLAEYCAQGTPGDMTTVTVEDNTLSTNDKGIRITDGAHVLASNFTIQNNCISGNTAYGLQNQHATELVNAELNAWGDASGPYHPVVNATGVGDDVSDNVDIYPWYLDCTMTTAVDLPVHNVTQDIYYYTIQSAIDAANPGDQITVAAGTFVEQLEITIPLTITGAGQGSTIVQSPDNLTLFYTTSADNYPIVYLHDVAGVTIEQLTVDGAGKGNANYRFNGIAFRQAGGTIQNVTLINVMDTPFSGVQHGVAVYAYNDNGTDRNINILNCTVQDFQKNAIALNGTNAICRVEGCVVTGAGDTTVTAQNGIQLGWGAGGTIKSNTVGDIRYTGPNWSASGILGYGDYGSAPINVEDNTVSNTQGALQIYWFNGDVNVADNNLAGNDFSFLYAFDSATVTGNSFDNCIEGLYLADVTNITAGDNTFNDCNVGLVVDGASDGVSFSDCEFIDNAEIGIAVVPYESDNPSNIVINCCQIAGNADYGVENTSSNLVDATVNWWGSATGPSGEGGGSGDAVSVNVDFFPWLLSTDCGDFTVVVADYVVDDDWTGLPNWSTVTVGGVDYYIGLNAFDTIQGAVDAASDGNSISVLDGNYPENPVIDKSVQIIGAGGETSTIESATGLVLVSINAAGSSVEFAGFTLKHTGTDNWGSSYAILVENGAYANIHDNLVADFKKRGIYVQGSDSSADITGNIILGENGETGLQNGIAVWNSGGGFANVVNNEVSGGAYTGEKWTGSGILILDTYDKVVRVKENLVYNNQVGIGAGEYCGYNSGAYSADVIIQGNILVDNEYGIDIFNDIRGAHVVGNDISGSAEYAITVTDYNDEEGWSGCAQPSDTVIQYNNIADNNTGLTVNERVAPVNAEYNWWGETSGPADPCGTSETDGAVCYDVSTMKNADGLGDGVTERADYCPWLNAAVSMSFAPYARGDVNYDGCVNWLDVAILADRWLEGCE